MRDTFGMGLGNDGKKFNEEGVVLELSQLNDCLSLQLLDFGNRR